MVHLGWAYFASYETFPLAAHGEVMTWPLIFLMAFLMAYEVLVRNQTGTLFDNPKARQYATWVLMFLGFLALCAPMLLAGSYVGELLR